MKFKEYTNPEGKDYDIKNNNNTEVQKEVNNKYVELLTNVIGILEDINEDELLNTYGITINEYYHPTRETIIKVKNHLEQNKKHL